MALGLLSRKNREVNKVVLLPLCEIHANPHQPRKIFDPDGLCELAESIKANGLLQPITVRRLQEGEYELVAGERRTLAFRALGREYIPAIIEEMSDEQSAVLALIENLQRRDLNFFEEAAGIAKLMQQLDLNQQQVSEKLGKAQSTVANKLRLLRYSPELQSRILQAGLTERHARALLRLDSADKLEQAVQYIIDHALNVEQTEQYVQSLREAEQPDNEAGQKMRLFVIKDMRVFHNTITKAVTLMHEAGIPVDSQHTEEGDYIEYVIRIPKDSVQQRRPVFHRPPSASLIPKD